jgi:hypothetical protein
LLDHWPIIAQLPSRPRSAQLPAQVGIGAGVEAEPGRQLRTLAKHGLEDPVIELARIAGAGARHHRAAAKREHTRSRGAAEQELAAVETHHDCLLPVSVIRSDGRGRAP